jgi:hypothetical protein
MRHNTNTRRILVDEDVIGTLVRAVRKQVVLGGRILRDGH